MKNYHSLLNIKYRFLIFNYVTIAVIIITLILMILIFTYSSYSTMGVYSGDEIIINVPLENSDAVMKGNYLMINDHKYNYKINEISSLQELNYVNYQEYHIKVNNTYKQNEVLEITFYYKKQRVIKKLLEIIF